MDFEKLAAERYSLRKFSDRPVEPEKLTQILEAGRNAPTAHNNQPQRILVIQSPELTAQLEEYMVSYQKDCRRLNRIFTLETPLARAVRM